MTLSPANNPANARGVGSYLLTPRWFLALPIVTSLSGLETVYSVQDGVDCQVPLSLIPQQDAITSVALTAPAIFNVTGSPITPGGSGTISLTLANEAQNSAFLGPSSGGAGVPSFRPLVASDIPTTLAGTTFTGSVSLNARAFVTDSTNQLTTFSVTNTGANGANILLTGNGSTTPSKSITVANGVFEIINSNYSAAILQLSDNGNLSVNGLITGSSIAQATMIAWFNTLPTTLPGTAGVLWNNGGTLSQS